MRMQGPEREHRPSCRWVTIITIITINMIAIITIDIVAIITIGRVATITVNRFRVSDPACGVDPGTFIVTRLTVRHYLQIIMSSSN